MTMSPQAGGPEGVRYFFRGTPYLVSFGWRPRWGCTEKIAQADSLLVLSRVPGGWYLPDLPPTCLSVSSAAHILCHPSRHGTGATSCSLGKIFQPRIARIARIEKEAS